LIDLSKGIHKEIRQGDQEEMKAKNVVVVVGGVFWLSATMMGDGSYIKVRVCTVPTLLRK
jgi:hypothetical protein